MADIAVTKTTECSPSPVKSIGAKVQDGSAGPKRALDYFISKQNCNTTGLRGSLVSQSSLANGQPF